MRKMRREGQRNLRGNQILFYMKEKTRLKTLQNIFKFSNVYQTLNFGINVHIRFLNFILINCKTQDSIAFIYADKLNFRIIKYLHIPTLSSSHSNKKSVCFILVFQDFYYFLYMYLCLSSLRNDFNNTVHFVALNFQ